MRQRVTEQSKSKKYGPIIGSDLGRNGLIRACDWSMLFALLLLCNTLTHFVISQPVLRVPVVSALEATNSGTAFQLCLQFQVAALQLGEEDEGQRPSGAGRGDESTTAGGGGRGSLRGAVGQEQAQQGRAWQMLFAASQDAGMRRFRVYEEAPGGPRPAPRERDASPCIRWHQAFALSPVRGVLPR